MAIKIFEDLVKAFFAHSTFLPLTTQSCTSNSFLAMSSLPSTPFVSVTPRHPVI